MSNRKLFALLFFASSLGASQDSFKDLENRVEQLERLNPTFHWEIQADALYWKASEDGLFYAFKQKNSMLLSGKIKNVTYDWDFGFRVGAQYYLPHNRWDTRASWTRFYTQVSNTATTDDEDFDTNEVILQTWTDPIDGSPVGQLASFAKGSSHFHLNVLNLDLGNTYSVSRHLFLRPFVGASGLWAHQAFSVDYKGNQLNFYKVAILLRNQFQGGGLRGGVTTRWYFARQWSVVGDVACCLIYGKQQLDQHQRVKSPAPTELTLSRIKNDWTIVKTLYDLSLALRFEQMFYQNRYCLSFQLGWEQHLLMGFNKNMNFLDESQTGKFAFNQDDLALNGFFFQTRFNF